jgi:peptidoglycan/LPS O-acetylase OafA/YrhL
MFFAFSGYLVAGSLQHCRTLTGFLSLRLLRLLPALAMEVILSTLVLGSLVTSLTLSGISGTRDWRCTS